MKKVLVSTDIGSDIDDALALLVMLNKGIDLRGIYTVNGDVDSRAYITKHMVNLSGNKITVARGESQSLNDLVEPYWYFEECLIDDSFIDEELTEIETNIKYKPIEKVGIIPRGVDDLADRLAKERYVIFSIAPMTNIAKLLQRYPESAKNIEKLYIMGFRFSEGSTLEHNVNYDPYSADLVLNSDIPIVVIPADLCNRYMLPIEILEQLNSPVGRYVRHMAKAFLAAKTAQEFVCKIINGLSLIELCKGFSEIPSDKLQTLTKEAKLRLYNIGERLTVNLRYPYVGALDPDSYFQNYKELLEHLRDPELSNDKFNIVKEELINILEGLTPKELSVADVYVPYCFLYPEKLETEKRTIECDKRGKYFLSDGTKHEIVRDLDFDHFKKFIKDSLF